MAENCSRCRSQAFRRYAHYDHAHSAGKAASGISHPADCQYQSRHHGFSSDKGPSSLEWSVAVRINPGSISGIIECLRLLCPAAEGSWRLGPNLLSMLGTAGPPQFPISLKTSRMSTKTYAKHSFSGRADPFQVHDVRSFFYKATRFRPNSQGSLTRTYTVRPRNLAI